MRIEDPESFAKYVRMSVPEFDNLAEVIKLDIQKQNTNYRRCISYQMRLAITLHFLATGDSFHSIKVAFRVGISTVSGIVAETCRAICKNLGGDMLRLTNQAVEWRKIEEGFNKDGICLTV